MSYLFVGILVCLLQLVAAQSALAASSSDFYTDVELSRIQSHGPWPSAIPPDPGNEYSGLDWAESAGKRLFEDPNLSNPPGLSCAQCHKAELGFTDGRKVAVGAQQHVRNTMGLLNVGQQRWFGWDGGTDSLWAASLRPLLSKVEMNQTVENIANYVRGNSSYRNVLERTLAGERESIDEQNDEALVVKVAKLIATYSRTLRSGETLFDRFRQALLEGRKIGEDKYPMSARRGLKLFVGTANCYVCHFGPNFSNSEFHDTGRPFFTGLGQVDPGRYMGIKRLRTDRYNLMGEFNGTNNDKEIRKTRTVRLSQVNWGQWRTPGLRNLTLTGPYMHDGSLVTLREVVDAYADIDLDRLHTEGESILQPLDLDNTQREDLVSFLKTLSPDNSNQK